MRRAALLVPVLLLAACSGGSSSGSADKKAYLAKAEALCAKGVAEQKKLVAPKAVADFGPYVKALVGIASSTTTSLAALTPPKADAAALRSKVLEPLQSQLRTAQTFSDDVQAATKGGDQAALGRLALNAPTKPQADLAYMRSYGFRACVDAADTSK